MYLFCYRTEIIEVVDSSEEEEEDVQVVGVVTSPQTEGTSTLKLFIDWGY
jgi:hypothetical protein